MPFRGRSSQTQCKHCTGALMRRSGCESEAVANVLMQMRVGKTGSAGIVLGKQRCDCCYTDSFPHFHCTRRKLQHPDLLCGQIHS